MLIYNSQTHKKEELKTVEPGKIRMYVCGPTVYDNIHVGNGRTFLSFDVIRRYLSYRGYQVTFAQNITDIDDKIINRAHEQGKTAQELAEQYSTAFIEIMHRFGILDPDIRPRATREIPAMIEMIEELIAHGHAYAASNGDVYFSVRSCDCYGEVSGRNIDELQVGARIEANALKKDPLDFAIWKAAKPGEPSWESPWGAGRPGWHTECCAMIHRYMGTPIDIHGGGSDLAFPHHENETAQACCAWHQPLANVWMHTGMLKIDGQKMSKSLGNFYTLKEVLDKYPADALRLLMLQTHYRSPLDFSFDRLEGSTGTLDKLKGCVKNLRWAASRAVDNTKPGLLQADFDFAHAIDTCAKNFTIHMDDDFNTASALADIFGLMTTANTYLDTQAQCVSCSVALRCADMLVELAGVLGIELEANTSSLPGELIDLCQTITGQTCASVDEAAETLLTYRQEARAQKNWDMADAIRDGINNLGLVLEDTAAGPRLKAK